MDILSNFRLVEEKQIVEKLFRQINTNSGLGVYGLNEILNYLKNNVVDTIIVTDSIDLYRIESKCSKCKNIQEDIVERTKVIQTKTELKNTPCSSCKSLGVIVLEQDIVDYISLLGAKTGTNVEVISGVAEHGIMVSNIGKIGAILRYNPNYTN
jgi:peptide chain release factor subunit 1